MKQASDHRLVLSGCGDLAAAEQLATLLVEQRLAACVNIVPNVRSIYRWKDKIEHGSEYLLIIKTTTSRLEELETTIKAQHSYELPEIITVSIEQGLPEYLDWITAAVRD